MSKTIEKQDTFTLSVEGIGNFYIREYIDGVAQEAFVDFVASHIFEDGNYYPLRKDPLMLVMFVESFVVDGDKLLEKDEDGDVDLYTAYHHWEASVGLMSAARGANANVERILNDIEEAVYLTVFHKRDQWNSILSSGMASTSGETLAALNDMVGNINEMAMAFNRYCTENAGDLENGLKEISTLNQLLKGAEKKNGKKIAKK